MSAQSLLYSQPVRLNQIGGGLERRLAPDVAARGRIARALDLQALDRFEADLKLAPTPAGWRLSGAVSASAVQTCGLTLEPLPVEIEQVFSIDLMEGVGDDPDEIEVSLDDSDGPDRIEDGTIDLGIYAVEQLALNLDPFPRKAGAAFQPPENEPEASPFAVLRLLTDPSTGEGG